MSEMMTFPDTWEEYEKSYGFTDNEEIYTNGARLIPSFRVKQWLDHLPSVQPEGIRCKDCKHWMMGKTTKNYPNPYICELHSFMHGFERSALPEDYCSWAELRGDSDG